MEVCGALAGASLRAPRRRAGVHGRLPVRPGSRDAARDPVGASTPARVAGGMHDTPDARVQPPRVRLPRARAARLVASSPSDRPADGHRRGRGRARSRTPARRARAAADARNRLPLRNMAPSCRAGSERAWARSRAARTGRLAAGKHVSHPRSGQRRLRPGAFARGPQPCPREPLRRPPHVRRRRPRRLPAAPARDRRNPCRARRECCPVPGDDSSALVDRRLRPVLLVTGHPLPAHPLDSRLSSRSRPDCESLGGVLPPMPDSRLREGGTASSTSPTTQPCTQRTSARAAIARGCERTPSASSSFLTCRWRQSTQRERRTFSSPEIPA